MISLFNKKGDSDLKLEIRALQKEVRKLSNIMIGAIIQPTPIDARNTVLIRPTPIDVRNIKEKELFLIEAMRSLSVNLSKRVGCVEVSYSFIWGIASSIVNNTNAPFDSDEDWKKGFDWHQVRFKFVKIPEYGEAPRKLIRPDVWAKGLVSCLNGLTINQNPYVESTNSPDNPEWELGWNWYNDRFRTTS